jgi:tetratricopeptide (TPR) repeat protein
MRRALAIAAVLALAPTVTSTVGPRSARADAPDARARKALADGERLFADQEYARAVKVLVAVTRDGAAPRAVRVRAWELIALARYIDGDLGGARDAFERLLEADPGFQLRDTSGSPRIRAFFDQDPRRGRARRGGQPMSISSTPRRARPPPAARVELDVRATRGADAVREVVVLYRRLGALAYREQPARGAADDRWRAALPLPGARQPYAVEYYVEARGTAGAVLARIASPDTPLSIPVAAGGVGGGAWYGRWYVITGAAVLAAGATGAVVWAASSGVADGSLPPGRVTVTP